MKIGELEGQLRRKLRKFSPLERETAEKQNADIRNDTKVCDAVKGKAKAMKSTELEKMKRIGIP